MLRPLLPHGQRLLFNSGYYYGALHAARVVVFINLTLQFPNFFLSLWTAPSGRASDGHVNSLLPKFALKHLGYFSGWRRPEP